MNNLRLFPTTSIRKTVVLNGVWHFSTPENFFADTIVPSCWEQYPSLASYRGEGTYVREVEVEYDSYMRFYFEGVSFFAKVYIDGKFLGKHYNGYTPFSITTFLKKGKHTLKVVVSNRYSYRSSLHVPNDYYSYGGITRGVVMEYIAPSYIESIGLVPQKCGETYNLSVCVNTKCLDNCIQPAKVICLLDGKEYNLGTIQCGQNETFFLAGLKVKEWSPEQPNLYLCQILLKTNNVIDDRMERVGFRSITIQKDGLYLNGKKYFLKGVNRHENGGKYGASVPFDLLKKDIALIKELNANFIRTSHYPNDSLFLDLCDEEGILVWEESHSRGLSLHQMMNVHFLHQVNLCAEEMVERHISHPCIVIWGCLNECADASVIGKFFYKKHTKHIRTLDGSRPVTFASCTPYRTKTLAYEDILSYNCYFGWTNQGEGVSTGFSRLLDWLRKDENNQAKPVFISEFGAGAIFGQTEGVYSEQNQASILQNNLDYYLTCREIMGVSVWQFADTRVDPIWFNKRPEGIAREGLVDMDRNKKKSYYIVQKAYDKI